MDDGVHAGSILILLVSGNIEPLVITRNGWQSMGQKVKAKKFDGNVLGEIDHQLAVEYLKRYIPNLDDPHILPTCPIVALSKSPAADPGPNVVICSPFRYNERNWRFHLPD